MLARITRTSTCLRLRAADRLERALLQHAQQLHLHGGRGGVDLVEKERAAVGGQESAGLVGDRAGERAFHVPEQFAFQQRFGQCAATDFDERLVPPRRAMMNRPGQQRFARAAFAGHQHRRPAVGDRLDQIENLQHLVIVPDDVLQAEAQIELLPERLVFEQQRLLPNRFLDDHADFIIHDRLGEIIERPHLRRFDGAFDRAVAGDDDDHDMRRPPADIAQKIRRLDAGHVDVRQQQFDLPAFRAGQGVLGGRSQRAHVVSLAAQELRKGLQNDPVLIENQNPRLMGRVGLKH